MASLASRPTRRKKLFIMTLQYVIFIDFVCDIPITTRESFNELRLCFSRSPRVRHWWRHRVELMPHNEEAVGYNPFSYLTFQRCVLVKSHWQT